jgi:hypothetical protein
MGLNPRSSIQIPTLPLPTQHMHQISRMAQNPSKRFDNIPRRQTESDLVDSNRLLSARRMSLIPPASPVIPTTQKYRNKNKKYIQ